MKNRKTIELDKIIYSINNSLTYDYTQSYKMALCETLETILRMAKAYNGYMFIFDEKNNFDEQNFYSRQYFDSKSKTTKY